MVMHEGQAEWCAKSTKKINTLVPSNRWGKTTVTSIKHIHKNFYKIGIGTGMYDGWSGVDYRTANLAPQSANTEACFNITKQILTSRFPIPQPDGSVKNNVCMISWFFDEQRTINTPPYMIYFINNSHVEFRSTGHDKAESIEGKPYGYISYDEGGRSDHLAAEVKGHIIGRLSDWNGTLDITSTPDTNSPSILYHFELYNNGLNNKAGYYTQEGSVFENTFLNDEYVEETMRFYGWNPTTLTFEDQMGEQVIYGKFVFSGATLYPALDILNAKTDEIKYGNTSINDGMPYEPFHKYIIGIDTAIGSDECVYTVVDITDIHNFKVVNKVWSKGNAKSPQVHIADLLDLFDMYNQDSNVKISLETWNGESARFYMDMPRNLQRVTKCYGSWQPPGIKKDQKSARLTNQSSLHVALRKKLAVKELKFAMNDDILTQQLVTYREDDKKLETDHVYSLALAVFQATDGKPKTTVAMPVSVEW